MKKAILLLQIAVFVFVPLFATAGTICASENGGQWYCDLELWWEGPRNLADPLTISFNVRDTPINPANCSVSGFYTITAANGSDRNAILALLQSAKYSGDKISILVSTTSCSVLNTPKVIGIITGPSS